MKKTQVIAVLDEAIEGLDGLTPLSKRGVHEIGFAIGVLKAVRWWLPDDEEKK